METQNLWPEFAIDKTKSPKAILKEQAGYLMVKTNNVLSAEVETIKSQRGIILHEFYIVAPAMNNYRYKLFAVKHEVIGYYPLTVETELDFRVDDEYSIPAFQKHDEAKNEEEFIRLLSTVFNNPENTQIISSLLSQSLAE